MRWQNLVKMLRSSLAGICLLLASVSHQQYVFADNTESGGTRSMDSSINDTTSGVSVVLQMQADAWNKGDLDTFMKGYMHSPNTSYTSGGVEVWGYEALRERYQKKYGDSRDTMGKLAFSDLKVFPLGSANALCIGHWHLERAGQPNLDGVFSLVLTHGDDGWKVLHDHTSVIDKK